MPVESEDDLTVELSIAGFVSTDAGVRANLIVSHVGETTLIDLSQREGSDIKEQLTTTLPAGLDYRVALILMLERSTANNDATGLLQIDLFEALLKL